MLKYQYKFYIIYIYMILNIILEKQIKRVFPVSVIKHNI